MSRGAQRAVEELQAGRITVYVGHGNSMRPKIMSGAKITLEPCTAADAEVGDAVLCRVKGNLFVHLVKAKQDERVLIGNNHGGINGWTKAVYGRVIKIDNL